jgi:hypothetical protein
MFPRSLYHKDMQQSRRMKAEGVLHEQTWRRRRTRQRQLRCLDLAKETPLYSAAQCTVLISRRKYRGDKATGWDSDMERMCP